MLLQRIHNTPDNHQFHTVVRRWKFTCKLLQEKWTLHVNWNKSEPIQKNRNIPILFAVYCFFLKTQKCFKNNQMSFRSWELPLTRGMNEQLKIAALTIEEIPRVMAWTAWSEVPFFLILKELIRTICSELWMVCATAEQESFRMSTVKSQTPH